MDIPIQKLNEYLQTHYDWKSLPPDEELVIEFCKEPAGPLDSMTWDCADSEGTSLTVYFDKDKRVTSIWLT